jgi:hypothetical protein
LKIISHSFSEIKFSSQEYVELGLLWLGPSGIIAGGAFAIFEGRTGWCAARAMGFRTPI